MVVRVGAGESHEQYVPALDSTADARRRGLTNPDFCPAHTLQEHTHTVSPFWSCAASLCPRTAQNGPGAGFRSCPGGPNTAFDASSSPFRFLGIGEMSPEVA